MCALRHISLSVLLIIFSHNLDLRENVSFASARKLFVREYMNCLTARKFTRKNKRCAKFDGIKVINKPLLYCYGKGSQNIDGIIISEQPNNIFKCGENVKGHCITSKWLCLSVSSNPTCQFQATCLLNGS